MMKFYFYSFLLLLFSCSSDQDFSGKRRVIESLEPIEEKLTAEILVKSENLINVLYDFHTAGNLLFAIDQQVGDSIISIYDLDKGKKIDHLTTFGRGPADLIQVTDIESDEDYLYAYDFVNQKIGSWDIDNLENHVSNIDIQLPTGMMADQFVKLYDEYWFTTLFEPDPGIVSVFSAEGDFKENLGEFNLKNHPDFPKNVVKSFYESKISSNNTDVCLCYRYADRVDFYKRDSLVYQIISPESEIPNISINSKGNDFNFNEKTRLVYLGCALSQKHFYGLYSGKLILDKESDPYHSRILIKMDLDTKKITVIELDIPISKMDYNAERNSIIGKGKVADERLIVEYQLK